MNFANGRHFVVTAGRSGSTLLCSILADAGANFGLPTPESWDESGGAFENPTMWRAAERYHAAYKISPDRPSWPKKWLWDSVRWDAKRQLARSLRQAQFFKAINIDLTVQPSVKLGYFPSIIISFRPFADQLLSLAGMFTERSADCHEREYLRTYRNALLWLRLYGGCVVAYDEMIDLRCADWIKALAETSRLSAEAIATSRRRRVLPRLSRGDSARPASSEAIADLEYSLQSLSGLVIPPSHVALRDWFSRNGKKSDAGRRPSTGVEPLPSLVKRQSD